jgi:hypothetical protein
MTSMTTTDQTEPLPADSNGEVFCPACRECGWFTLHLNGTALSARCQNCGHEIPLQTASPVPPERLRLLADWLDTDDEFKTTMFPEMWPARAHEVQDDLRRWADLIEKGARA